MVDDRMSLTFSVRNNRGRYALLIGSGVSTGAGIPTGWAVVEDLIEKIAAAHGREEPEDPFEWYKEEYGKEARYDDIIGEMLHASAAELGRESSRGFSTDYSRGALEIPDVPRPPADVGRAVG